MPPSLSLCRNPVCRTTAPPCENPARKMFFAATPRCFFECDQFFDLGLRGADACTIFISPDAGGNLRRGRADQDVVPGAHHVTAVDGHGAHGGVRENVAHRNREFQLLGDRNEIFAIRTETMQPDDAVFRCVADIQGDAGENSRHFCF